MSAQILNLELPFGLVVDSFRLSASGGSAETKPFSLSLSESALVEATVSQGSLLNFLTRESPGNVRMEALHITPKGIVVTASIRVLIELKGNALCQLRIEDRKRIIVVLEEVDVMGVGAKGLVQNQIDQINPVLDAADLPFNIELTEVELRSGELVIRGTANP